MTNHFSQETGIRLGLKMWSFLLLVLSLNTGCLESMNVKGCTGGWFEFTCSYPNPNKKYQKIKVETPRKDIERFKENTWQTEGTGLFLFHDTTAKLLRMIVNPLGNKDFGDYECKFDGQKTEYKLRNDGAVCPDDFSLTTYRTAQATIDCNQQGFSFICKQNSFTCDTILRGSLVKTISSVSERDAGVYWCGAEVQTQGFRVSRRKIHLEVKDIEVTQRQITSGQNFTHECKYENLPVIKFFCKGEDPLKCEQLVSSATKRKERFLFKDDKVNSVTITVLNVTIEDTGSYWCGVKGINGKEELFFHKLELTVVASTSSAFSTISSTDADMATTATVGYSLSPTQTARKQDESWKILLIVAAVFVSLLLLLLGVFCINKRFSRFSNATENKEDHCYEEIVERPQKPGSGTAVKTIYTTVTLPSAPPIGPLYFTLDHPTSAHTNSPGINPSSASSDENFTTNVLYYSVNPPQERNTSS